MIKTALKIVGAVVAVLLVLVLGTFGYVFGLNQAPRGGPALNANILEVADSFATTYLFELSSGKIVLIDAGNDASGTPILEALEQRHKTADDVVGIFITHAHPDHDAAVAKFPKAQVYAMQEEAAIADASEPYNSPLHRWLGDTNPHPFKVTHPLHDQEAVMLEDLTVTAYAVPGHTPGSALYLARGVLFLGDAANIGRGGNMRPPVWLVSRNVDQGLASLAAALDKIAANKAEVRMVTSSHSGNMEGAAAVAALRQLASQ